MEWGVGLFLLGCIYFVSKEGSGGYGEYLRWNPRSSFLALLIEIGCAAYGAVGAVAIVNAGIVVVNRNSMGDIVVSGVRVR